MKMNQKEFIARSNEPGFAYFETQLPNNAGASSYLFYDPVEIKEFRKPEDFDFRVLAELSKKYYVAAALGYELNVLNEKIPERVLGQTRFPAVWIGVYKKCKKFSFAEAQKLSENINYAAPQTKLKLKAQDFTRNEYCSTIERIRKHIYRGDIYQVNFTQRLYFDFEGSPLAAYFSLKNAQPVPYGAFMNLGAGRFVVSNSPELFFSIDADRKIISRPMKGTRPAVNAENKEILYKSAKDRAENVMIVDLMRNDFGRICEFDSIRVSDLYAVEKYSTVYQMVSQVQGRLKQGIAISDVFSAIYPAGSITGAPKKRAMEIVYENEVSPRGFYTGSLGFVFPDGPAKFNVAIRTLLIDAKKHSAEYGTGGGIVYDSDADKEYDEMLLKAKNLEALF